MIRCIFDPWIKYGIRDPGWKNPEPESRMKIASAKYKEKGPLSGRMRARRGRVFKSIGIPVLYLFSFKAMR
jgi:hypothetical protein